MGAEPTITAAAAPAVEGASAPLGAVADPGLVAGAAADPAAAGADAAAGVQTTATADAAAVPGAANLGTAAPAATNVSTTAPAVGNVGSAAAPAAGTGTTAGTSTAANVAEDGLGWGNNAAGAPFSAAAGAGAQPSYLTQLTNFATKNPMVTFGAVQGLSSLLSGWTSSLTPAQVAQLNAQADANQAAANLTNQQAANLAQPKAIASTMPVTGTPQPLVPVGSAPGFLNAQAQTLVTGKVAA
jgi:hypothetical protein